jgi:ribokinase
MSVLVLGSINLDLVVEAPRLPVRGETLSGTAFHTSPGGKGANQAVAAARQGAPTQLIGRVGGDEFGDQLLEAIRAAGVRVSAITIDRDASTGIALICVDPTGQNTIVTVKGANGNIGSQELELLDRLRLQSIVLLVQLEVPLAVVTAAAEAAREAGVIVVLDPAPVTDLPDGLLQNVSWITPNETETKALTGIEPSDEGQALRAAEALRERGVHRAVITLGERGCVYAGPETTMAVPAPKVDAIDTVGAGDAFNGALAASIVAGRDVPGALRAACAAGAIACTRRGALASLPTAAEVEAALASS